MSGVLFMYASIIFGKFYFDESKETRLIKFSRKLSILQKLKCVKKISFHKKDFWKTESALPLYTSRQNNSMLHVMFPLWAT